MSKITIASVTAEREEAYQKLANAETKNQNLRETIKEKDGVIGELTEKLSNTISSLNFFNGRTVELIVAHDILLRTSLLEKGVHAQDVERIISESRRNFDRGGADMTLKHYPRGQF